MGWCWGPRTSGWEPPLDTMGGGSTEGRVPDASPTRGLQNRVWYWGELFRVVIWQAELVPA